MENLNFFKGELERIKKGIAKLDPAKQTQKYVNLISCGTNLVGFTSQLENLIKAKEEAKRREEENRIAREEAERELSETKKQKKSKTTKVEETNL